MIGWLYDLLAGRAERAGIAELRRNLLAGLEGEVVEIGLGPAAAIVEDRERVRRAALEQFGGGVEALGITEEEELRLLVDGRQAVDDKAVMGCGHSGTTAMASISTSALGSTRRTTSTSAIAG